MVLAIESLNYSKCQQTNVSLGLFVKTKFLLCSKSSYFFPFSLLMFVSGFESSGVNLFPVSDQKEKSSAVSEHDSLKNSGTVSEYEVLEGGLRAAREDSCVIQGKGILQTPQPIKEALLEFGLTLPLVSAFTSDAYFQGPQTQRNKKKIKF